MPSIFLNVSAGKYAWLSPPLKFNRTPFSPFRPFGIVFVSAPWLLQFTLLFTGLRLGFRGNPLWLDVVGTGGVCFGRKFAGPRFRVIVGVVVVIVSAGTRL